MVRRGEVKEGAAAPRRDMRSEPYAGWKAGELWPAWTSAELRLYFLRNFYDKGVFPSAGPVKRPVIHTQAPRPG